jgi:hypothetical protein
MGNWKTWTVGALGIAVGVLGAALAQRGVATAAGVRPLTAQDYADIQQLLHRYMFALDACNEGKPYSYADLYTADGVFMTGGGETPTNQTKGREALSRYGQHPDGTCNPSGVRGLQNEFHFNIGAIIEPSPEGARGKSYLLMLHTPMGQIRYAGWYEDLYAKTPAGWRFKSRFHHTGYSILYDSRVPGFDKELGARDLGPNRAQPARGTGQNEPGR